MTDGPRPLPPHPDDDDGIDSDLERELRALFAPVAAPREFRQRLKTELLGGTDRLVMVDRPLSPAQGAGIAGRVTAPLIALATHRRATAVAVSVLAAAAALLLTLRLTGAFGPALRSALPPAKPSATARVSATPARPAPTKAPVIIARARPTAAATVTPTPQPSPTPRPTPTSRPAATNRPTATPTRVLPTATAAIVVGHPVPVDSATPPTATTRPTATATVQPTAKSTATPTPVPPAATATAAIVVGHPVPVPVDTATPRPPIATATKTIPKATAIAAPRPAATATQTPPAHHPATPTKTPHRLTLPPIPLLPPPDATATPRPRSTPTARPRATATNTNTNTPMPTAASTPRPSSTPTARPRSTATVTATNTPITVPTDTATVPPTATRTPDAVRIPLAQVKLPIPNPDNAVLFSPLSGALSTEQPVSYSLPLTTGLALPPQAPPSLFTITPTLPVYPITPTEVTIADAYAIMSRLGVQSVLMAPQGRDNGAVMASVQVDNIPYTLTVYGGYGAPWFSLHAFDAGVGVPSAPRLAGWADAWLHGHQLARPDLSLLVAYGNSAYYGQNIAGLPLLRPSAAVISFDGSGTMRDLRYEYVVPGTAMQSDAQAPQLAVASAIEAGQGLYRGPAPGTFTGTPTITGMTIGFAGVRGAVHDYLEPVYVLNGTVATTSGPQGFSLYARAV